MSKTRSVLLLFLFAAVSIAVPAQASAPENVTLKVTVVDKDLNLKSVPKFALSVRKPDDVDEVKASTNADGVASVILRPGKYVVTSAGPLEFEGKSFTWKVPFSVEFGKPVSVELSSDNAVIGKTDMAAASGPRRRINAAGEMFGTLRNGVVTVEGELGSATGFIIDENGLVLTNQRVITETNEVRVRFDKKTAVKARVLAVDVDRDLAVLQINLSAFPNSKALKVAKGSAESPAIVEGEEVFSIGSRQQQDKVLTTGIASKIEHDTIIADIAFDQGNAGSPLFNSLGEVVGISSFDVNVKDQFQDKDKVAPGLTGVVRIEECASLIENARQLAATKNPPSAELMPNLPDGTFPVDTIKKAIASKNFPVKDYVSNVKNYEVKYMTPVFKFYAIEKDRIESLKIREKRNKGNGEADMFRDLRSYSEYAGELVPVVDILALPEITPTAKSLLLSAATNLTIGYSTPFDLKYKADFYSMRLSCDGKEIRPLRRSKTEIDKPLQNYYKTKKRYTYAGIYSYPYELFAPGQCTEIKVQIFSEEDIEEPITTVVSDVVKKRIWSDFQDFRSQIVKQEKP